MCSLSCHGKLSSRDICIKVDAFVVAEMMQWRKWMFVCCIMLQ